MAQRGYAVDENQKQCVDALRKLGYRVFNCSGFGQGFPDSIVGYPGVNLLVEWKKDEKQRLTPAQVKFHSNWPGPLITAIGFEEVHAKMTELIAKRA